MKKLLLTTLIVGSLASSPALAIVEGGCTEPSQPGPKPGWPLLHKAYDLAAPALYLAIHDPELDCVMVPKPLCPNIAQFA